jgi:hypothetical protein
MPKIPAKQFWSDFKEGLKYMYENPLTRPSWGS